MISTPQTVLIMAGGTGGHVFPALAVARELRAAGVPVHWLGTRAGIEADVVPREGIAITYVDVAGVRGQGAMRLVLAPVKILRAVLASRQVIRDVNARAVLGMGGFVTGPGGIAAKLCGVPLIVHEQNAVAGFTNKVLAGIATHLLCAFPQAFAGHKRARWVGNPVRADIAALPAPTLRYAAHQGPLRLLVLGGSQGAVGLNASLPEALARIAPESRPIVRHQCGRKHVDAAQAAYQAAGVQAEVLPFIDDMAAAYDWADMVLCRSGAMTVSEIAAAGLPALFVPYPHAVDDHQTANALFLVQAGAARLVQQSELSATRLQAELLALGDRAQLLQMAERARKLAKTNATAQVMAACLGEKA